nr:hypothetical protein JVH1_3960 [Rhodococcus sp. JVH1]
MRWTVRAFAGIESRVFDGLKVPRDSVMHVGGTGGSGLTIADRPTDRLLLRINGSLTLTLGVARAAC